MTHRRVVITGLGALTPVGNSAAEFWNGLVEGKSGVRTNDRFDTTDFATKIAGLIEGYAAEDHFERKEARRLDPTTQYALVATDKAIEDTALDLDAIDKDRVGVMIGTGIGGMKTYYENCIGLHERGPRGISPFFVPMMIPDIAAGQVSIRYGFKGPNFCAVSACATGSSNIGLAFDSIRLGTSDIAIAGGADASVVPIGIGGFNAMKALSTRNDSPETASRPFDATRDGFVLGEGAGILVLESLEHAVARGARIYSEIVGYGFSADAYHVSAPDPEGNGVKLAMSNACDMAGIAPSDIDHINMHGTSTRLGDAAETRSIKSVFGDHAYSIQCNSTKSMTGHTLGAAGAIESIAALLTTYHDVIPPTINFSEHDPECDLNYTFNESVVKEVHHAMNNAFGFGGHNTALVFKKYQP